MAPTDPNMLLVVFVAVFAGVIAAGPARGGGHVLRGLPTDGDDGDSSDHELDRLRPLPRGE